MLTFSAITRTVSSLMILDELSILSTLSVGAEALGRAVPQPRKSAPLPRSGAHSGSHRLGRKPESSRGSGACRARARRCRSVPS